MKKFTKFWQLMVVLLLTSSVAFGQYSVQDAQRTKADVQKEASELKQELKKEKASNASMEQEQTSSSNESLQAAEVAPQQQEAISAGIEGIEEGTVEETVAGPQKGKVQKAAKLMAPNPGSVADDLFCPAGTVWGQPVSGFTSAGNSDVDGGYRIYQQFTGAFDITDVHWWGLQYYFDGTAWGPCSENPMDFEIVLYQDNAGMPGTPVQTYNVNITGTDTGEPFAAGTVFEYNYTLPTTVSLANGWVSIQGNPGNLATCWFLWVNSGTPGINGQQEDIALGTFADVGYPMSLCLLGTYTYSNDVGVTDVLAPVSGTLGATEAVTIEVFNFGGADQSGFDVNFTFGGTTYTEVYTNTLVSGTSGTYTFTQTIDASVPGPYTLDACTELGTDENLANDCFNGYAFNSIAAFDCDWEIWLYDTYGDGWNGAFLDVTSDGVLVLDDITIPTLGGPDVFTFGVNEGATVQTTYFVGSNSWPEENWYEIYDNFGALVASTGPTAAGPPDLTLTSTCLPPACPAPTALFTNNIGTTDARANWTPGGAETLWNLEYGPAGFALGTGTNLTGLTNPNPLGGNPYYDITGLTGGTTYDWYVQADCGTDAVSTWVGPVTFTTSCVPLVAPWIEGFEGGVLPPCWVQETADDLDWTVDSGGTPSTATGPSSGANGSTWYIYVETSGSTALDVATIYTPPIDLTALTQPELSFWYHMYGLGMTPNGTVDVGISTDGGATYTSVWSQSGNMGNSWLNAIVDISAYSGTVNFSITGTVNDDFTGGGFTFENDFAIDDFEVREFTACPDPAGLLATNITGSTADLTWTSFSGLSNVEWGPAGFTPGTGTLLTGVTSPVPLTGLAPATAYEFYVEDDCGGGTLSNLVGPAAFATPQPSGELLYQIDLETICGTNRILASHFFAPTGTLWVTASTSSAAGGNEIYEVDPFGMVLLNTYPQTTTSIWGMRDMADDGTLLYAGDDNGFYSIDPLTGTVSTIFTGQTFGVIRALAYDPVTMTFWTKSFGANIFNFDITGTVLNGAGFVNAASAYGAAWNPNDGTLWLHATAQLSTDVNEFIQIDPLTGLNTGAAIGVPDSPCSVTPIVGGGFLDFGNMYPGRNVLGGTLQATPDVLHIVEFNDTGFPDQAFNHMPLCGTIDVPTSGTLTWDFGASTGTYDLWFGPVGAMVQVVTGAAVGGPTGSYAYTGLAGQSMYEWRVDGFNITGPTMGLPYSFTTVITCPQPTALIVSNITLSSADLDWTESGAATNWEIEYGPAGFTPGTGTQLPVAAKPYTLGGLNSSTAYDWYVRADCGGGDLSMWSGPNTFTTACGVVAAPFTESFDVQGDPACWTNTSSNPVSNGLWEYGNATTNAPAYGAAGIDDNTGNGGFFAWSDGSTPVVADITLITPMIDASTLTSPQLTFFVYSNNTNNPGDNVPLIVDYWDGAAWNNVLTYAADDPNWVEVAIPLSFVAYPVTGDVQIRFITDQSVAGTAFYNDILIDDISYDEAPPCPDPTGLGVTNVTPTSADLVWISNSGLSNVEYGPIGFTPGTGTPMPGVTSPLPLTGLSGGYDFYVEDDCGGGLLSGLVGPFTFYTTPVNDDCADAIPVTAPATVSGTTNGATTDCIGVLNWDAVWYEIALPYAQNKVTINMCLDDVGAILNNTGIILTSDCSCDPASFIFSDGSWIVSGNCINSLVFNVAGPGTVLYPVQTDPKGDFTFDVAIEELYTLEGTVMYLDGVQPMDLITVTADDGTDAVVASVFTDLTGYFMIDGLPAGTYTLDGATDKARGGTDVGDINQVINHILGSPLTGLPFLASDLDLTTLVDVGDLNLMINDILGSPGWAAPDWIFENPSVTVPTSKAVVDFMAVASGDPDPTHIVPAAPAGAVCDNAIPLAFDGSGPTTVTAQTNCGLGNFYDETCLDLYDGGEDIIYMLTVTGDWAVDITLDPKGTTYTGFLISDVCPTPGTACLDFSTNSGGGAHTIANLFLTAGTYYIMVDTWPAPNCIPDFDLTIAEWVPSYCAASSNSGDEWIVDITVGTIADGPFVQDGIYYHDYTATSTDMALGVGYPINFTNGSPYASDQGTVWVDWNQDFDFDDPGEEFPLVNTLGDGSVFDGTITPPAGATLGNTRMRVRVNYTALPEPCGSPSWGEVLDYTVNVTP